VQAYFQPLVLLFLKVILFFGASIFGSYFFAGSSFFWTIGSSAYFVFLTLFLAFPDLVYSFF